MILDLFLETTVGSQIPSNYQYPILSMVYKVIAEIDHQYCQALHRSDGKSIRFFTFSKLFVDCKKVGDRLIILSKFARLRLCFEVPTHLEKFISGLLLRRYFDIADHQSRATFIVTDIKSIQSNFLRNSPDIASVTLKPISPVVVHVRRDDGNFNFLNPEDKDFCPVILTYWMKKYQQLYKIDDFAKLHLENEIKIKIYCPNYYRPIKVEMKHFTVIGFDYFFIDVQAPKKAIELVLNTGIGNRNSQGFGCVKIFNDHEG